MLTPALPALMTMSVALASFVCHNAVWLEIVVPSKIVLEVRFAKAMFVRRVAMMLSVGQASCAYKVLARLGTVECLQTAQVDRFVRQINVSHVPKTQNVHVAHFACRANVQLVVVEPTQIVPTGRFV